MFKSAAAKLAHNSTIPALAGNKALRPLQDLITAEKAIITSLARLSLHFSRASEALRIWGRLEGDDLFDTLGASTKLLLEFSSSLTKFAGDEQAIREYMKAVRTQEESLDALKTRRKSVASKADSAERKLNRMDSGHKDTPAQSALLDRLQDTIRELDTEIMTGEAKLGDFKRTAANAWMTLKFGGLQECCRKGLIVAEAGNLIMAELPQLVSDPGSARPFYTGNVRTEAHVAEAQRALGEVSFDAPTPTPFSRVQFPPNVNSQDGDSNVSPTLPDEFAMSMSRSGFPGDGDGTAQYRGQYEPNTSGPSSGERSDYRPQEAFRVDEHGAIQPKPDVRRFQSFSRRKPPSPPSSNTFSRGDSLSLSQQIGSSAPTGGRFATFPVKSNRQDSVAPVIGEPLVGPAPFSNVERALPEGGTYEAVPIYEAIEGIHTSPPGPPPGAAPPAMPHASFYGGYDPGSYDSGPSFVPDNTGEKEDDSQLPYMISPRSERKMPFGSRPLPMPRPLSGEAVPVEEPNERAPISTEADPFSDPVQASLTSTKEESTPPSATQALVPQDRTPPPPPPPPPPAAEDPDDELSLNAAVAREVSREMDSLMYHPPAFMQRGLPPRPSGSASLNVPPPQSSGESFTHPSAPFTPSRRRVSGSPPAPRSPTGHPSPVNDAPSPHTASVPSSSPQQTHLPPPSIALGRSPSPSLSSVNSAPFQTPPELPPSPSSVKSPRTLSQPAAVSIPGKTPPFPRSGTGMISVAAFRRPPARTGTEPLAGSRDMGGSIPSLSGVQPPGSAASLPQEQHQEDEFDYISAYYSTGEDGGSPPPWSESRARSSSLR